MTSRMVGRQTSDNLFVTGLSSKDWLIIFFDFALFTDDATFDKNEQ